MLGYKVSRVDVTTKITNIESFAKDADVKFAFIKALRIIMNPTREETKALVQTNNGWDVKD